MAAKLDKKRVAVIDLGSNSFHLVFAEVMQNDFTIVARIREQVQLAKYLDDNNNLSQVGFQTGLDAITKLNDTIRAYSPNLVKVLATNTIRVAKNQRKFVNEAEKILNQKVDVLTGLEEAKLIFTGATINENGDTLVIDIGGGSTEIIKGTKNNPRVTNSLQIGCVTNLMAKMPLEEVMDIYENKATNLLLPIRDSYLDGGWDECCGCSGTVTAVIEILRAESKDSVERITLQNLYEIKQNLKTKPADYLRGLRKSRVGVFPSGLSILIAIFQSLNIKSMKLSAGGLREGMLYKLAEKC